MLRIDGDSGEVIWRLGKSNRSDAEWTASGVQPPLRIVGDPEGEFCGQHSARMIENGNLLLFDNGVACLVDPEGNRARPGEDFSRVVEYAIDPDHGEAIFQRHYSYHGEFNRLAPTQGHIELLETGNWLITWGSMPVDEHITEYSPLTGEEVLIIKLHALGDSDRGVRTTAYPVSSVALAKKFVPLTAEIVESPAGSAFHLGPSDAPKVIVAFSRPVVDFAADTSSVSVTGATIAGISPHVVAGDPSNAYLFTLTPTGVGPITFALVAGRSCASGGPCTADGTVLTEVPASHVIPPRPTGPAVMSIASSATHPTKDAFTVTIAFSEPVTGLAADDIGVTNGTGSNFAGAGAIYTLDIAPDPGVDGEVLVTVPAGAVTDALNNVNLESTAAFRVDTKAPALAAGGAVVNGAALTLFFDEALDAAARPAGAFTVTAGGESRGVTAVSVAGSSATLALDPAVTRGDGAASVSYAPPAAGGLRDELGNPVAAFADERAANETPNAAPTGRPTITGSALVGETLRASVAGIADADGLDGAAFRYRWLRSEGAADTDVPGAASAEYTIQPADERRLLKVRVTFTDGGGTEERLASAATGEVAALRPSVDGRALAEASGTVTVTVGTGGVQVAGALTIELELGGTATRGTDYRIGSDRLQLVAGASAASTTVTAVDDAVDDDGETIEITARLGSRTLGVRTVTIVDDDERGVVVSRSVVEVPEGGSERYTVVLTSEPTAPVEVTLSAELSGTDLSVDRTRLDFTRSVGFTGRSWDEPRSVELSAAEDDDALADPAVIIRHKADGGDYASTAGPAVEARIVEDDSPVLSVGEASAAESDGAVVFEVTLSTAGSADATVDYATSDGTAAAGSDYTATGGTLTFAAGSSARPVDRRGRAGRRRGRGRGGDVPPDAAQCAARVVGGRRFGAAGPGYDSRRRRSGGGGFVRVGALRRGRGSGGRDERGSERGSGTCVGDSAGGRRTWGARRRGTTRGLPASVGFGPGLTRQSFAVLAVDDPEEDAGESGGGSVSASCRQESPAASGPCW